MNSAATDRVWRALADPTRRAMLDYLATRPRTTGELVERFDGLCRTAIMKHLDVLTAAELVIVRREGRSRWNHLNPVPIQRVCERWVSRHSRRLASSMLRLKQVAERNGPTEKTKRKKTSTCPPKRRSRSTSSKSASKPVRSGSGRP